jgi:hypothetical protein
MNGVHKSVAVATPLFSPVSLRNLPIFFQKQALRGIFFQNWPGGAVFISR